MLPENRPAPRTDQRLTRTRRRLGSVVLGVVLGMALQLIAAMPVFALGGVVTVDDFSGTHFGVRTVTPLPLPATSTTAPGTFVENGDGTATMTMNGNGNGAGGVQLDYASAAPVDLSAGGNNKQFFIYFPQIARLPVITPGETGLIFSVSVVDNGVTHTSGSVGISNDIDFSPALDFAANFSGSPSMTKVTHITIMLLYPQNHDSAQSLTLIMGKTRATPSGGSPPAVPSPTVTATAPTVTGGPGTSIGFQVAFSAGGQSAAVTNNPPSTTGLRPQDLVLNTTGTGTLSAAVSGGPSTYSVSVTGMTSSGTVSINVPAGIVGDSWNQPNIASSGDPTVAYTFAIPPVFTSATSTTFSAGSAGTFTATATGLPTPALTHTTGALPTGVTFTSATGVLAGTPTVGTGGSYSIGLQAANVAATVTQAFTLTVDEAAGFSSPGSGALVVGTAGSAAITTTGFPRPSVTETGALPSGVTFTDAGNGTDSFHGTPALGSGGTYRYTLTAHNGIGSDATQAYILTIAQTSPITSANSDTLTVGAAGTFTVTTGGGFPTPPTLSHTGALPSGVTFVDNGNGTATLSGTPSVSTGGTYPLTFTSHNGSAPDGTQSFTLTIDEAPSIRSSASAAFTAGQAANFTVTTGHDFPTATTISESGSLPGGVSFLDQGNGTAALAGTPSAGTGGAYAFTITAHNGVAPDATQSFTLTVDETVAITSANATTFIVGATATFTVTTAGGYPAATTLSETGTAPSGVTFVDNGNGTATLSGVAASGTGGTYPLTVRSANGAAPDATQAFVLSVDEAPSITSGSAAIFVVGQSSTFTVTTGHAFPVPALQESGALPSGVTFVDNGNGTASLTGTPNAATGGTYPFTVTAGNGVAPDGSQAFSLTVAETSTITSAHSATLVVGTSGAFTVTTSGGFPTPPTLAESGALPSGVSFVDNGNGTASLAGTPSAGSGASYPITITAANSGAPTGSQSFTLTVDEAPSIASGPTATFVAGAAGSFTVTTAHDFPSVTVITESGALPAGVTLVDNGDGTATLAGTPAAATGGVYPLTLTAANGVAPSASHALTLTIDEAPVATWSAGTTFTVGTAGSLAVVASPAFPAPSYTTSSTLPSGLTFVDNGNGTATLSGTAATGSGGTYSVSVTASNGVAPAATVVLPLTVDEAPTITSAASTAFAVGSPSSFSITTAHEYPTPSTLTETGVLPTGVTFTDNGDGTATLGGTPSAGSGGSYLISLGASNGVAPAATRAFTLTIGEPVTITSVATTTFVVGTAGTFTVTTAHHFPVGTISESGSLPTGVTFVDNGDGTATLSGSAAALSGGTYALSVSANDGIGSPAVQAFVLTVNEAPGITSSAVISLPSGVPGSFAVTATGFPQPTFAETGTLPSGVTLDAVTGALSGTAALGSAGVYSLVITATNGVGAAAAQNATLSVAAVPVTLTMSVSPNPPTAGQPVIITVIVTGPAGFPKPVGTVTIVDNGIVLGTAVVDPGTAILRTTLTGGAHVLAAIYSGDTNYAAIGALSAQTSVLVAVPVPQTGASSSALFLAVGSGGALIVLGLFGVFAGARRPRRALR